ncbi:unnamed protein product [Cunninghamella blakesleeana]
MTLLIVFFFKNFYFALFSNLGVLFALVLAILLNVVLAAPAGDDGEKYYGICSCFRPQYDVGCCNFAGGKLYTGGGTGKYSNTCNTPDFGESVTIYKECCAAIKGEITKCKRGVRA